MVRLRRKLVQIVAISGFADRRFLTARHLGLADRGTRNPYNWAKIVKQVTGVFDKREDETWPRKVRVVSIA